MTGISRDLTLKQAANLSPKDVEFVALTRFEYGGQMRDVGDVVSLQARDKSPLVGVKYVAPRLTEAAHAKRLEKSKKKDKPKPKSELKPEPKEEKKAIKKGSDKSMSGKGKTK